jgi:hypothetical protein
MIVFFGLRTTAGGLRSAGVKGRMYGLRIQRRLNE